MPKKEAKERRIVKREAWNSNSLIPKYIRNVFFENYWKHGRCGNK